MALKASPQDQALLLDLQALDTKLQQLAHQAGAFPEHAELGSGGWPRPGAQDTEAALAEPVAAILRVGVGDRLPITDRVTAGMLVITEPVARLLRSLAGGRLVPTPILHKLR